MFGLLQCPFVFILKLCKIFDFARNWLVIWKDDGNIVQFDDVFDEKLVDVRCENMEVVIRVEGDNFS